MNFKEFHEYCKLHNILKATCGDMSIEIKYEPKVIELPEVELVNEEDEYNEILFHSTTRG